MHYPANVDQCLAHVRQSVSAWHVLPGWVVLSGLPNMQGNVLSCNMTSSTFNLVDFTPNWDYTVGGAKMIITFRSSGAGFADRPLVVMFDDNQVRLYFCCGTRFCQRYWAYEVLMRQPEASLTFRSCMEVWGPYLHSVTV